MARRRVRQRNGRPRRRRTSPAPSLDLDALSELDLDALERDYDNRNVETSDPRVVALIAELRNARKVIKLLKEDSDWWQRQAYTRAELVEKLK